jgi:hypothetical protein
VGVRGIILIETRLTLDSGWEFNEKESENFELNDFSDYRACAMKCFQTLESYFESQLRGGLMSSILRALLSCVVHVMR